VAVALFAETGKKISEEVLRNLTMTWTDKDGNQIEGHACHLDSSSQEYEPMLEALMQSLEAKRLPKSVGASGADSASLVVRTPVKDRSGRSTSEGVSSTALCSLLSSPPSDSTNHLVGVE
jgi:hypothetical protein